MFDEASGLWNITIEDGRTYKARVSWNSNNKTSIKS